MTNLIRRPTDADEINRLLAKSAEIIATLELHIPRLEAALSSDNPRIPALEGDEARQAIALMLRVMKTTIDIIEDMRRLHTQ